VSSQFEQVALKLALDVPIGPGLAGHICQPARVEDPSDFHLRKFELRFV